MSNVDQMIENVRIARLSVRNFAEKLRTAGVIVHDYDYAVDPATGQITHMHVTIGDNFNPEEAKVLFTQMNMANISFGVGSLLRKHSRDDAKLAFKLHDFGFRRNS